MQRTNYSDRTEPDGRTQEVDGLKDMAMLKVDSVAANEFREVDETNRMYVCTLIDHINRLTILAVRFGEYTLRESIKNFNYHILSPVHVCWVKLMAKLTLMNL